MTFGNSRRSARTPRFGEMLSSARNRRNAFGDAASWRGIDDTAFGRKSRCSYLRFDFKLPSGIPTQVVEPSVSLAALLQGTAPTVFVETPSSATLFNPVSDPEISGPPTSGAPPPAVAVPCHA